MSTQPKVISMTKTRPAFELATITPEMARGWLECNIQNRPVREMTIRKYVEAMKSGQWEVNGETIKFSADGVLLDGQHRLRAIVQSGATVQSYVIHDLPAKVFDTIDTGANRSIGDLLALKGEVNNNVLGVALRLQYVHDELGSIRELHSNLARLVNNRDLLETLEKHPGMTASIAFIGGVPSLKKLLSPAASAFLHYQFTKLQPHHADAFFIKLARATDLAQDHPILTLRGRLEGLSKSTYAERTEAIAVTIKAWNAYRLQKPAKLLRWSKVEDFPEAV